jgi:hypothetical protein
VHRGQGNAIERGGENKRIDPDRILTSLTDS